MRRTFIEVGAPLLTKGVIGNKSVRAALDAAQADAERQSAIKNMLKGATFTTPAGPSVVEQPGATSADQGIVTVAMKEQTPTAPAVTDRAAPPLPELQGEPVNRGGISTRAKWIGGGVLAASLLIAGAVFAVPAMRRNPLIMSRSTRERHLRTVRRHAYNAERARIQGDRAAHMEALRKLDKARAIAEEEHFAEEARRTTMDARRDARRDSGVAA